MSSEIIQETILAFRRGGDLNVAHAEEIFDAIISETDEQPLVELLNAWNEKGVAEDEIFTLASIMRSRMKRVESKHKKFVDIVGTGGSKVKTFNISTAAAFVVAGQGVPVAKHGNKAATSKSGSADVLSALGIEPAVEPAIAERCLNEIGICFMYAPNFHRLSPTLGKVRRGLGFPTIFNCLGPLCNPAGALHQLIGVWDRSLVPKMANVLARLGTKKSWIVNGEDGSDEISVSGPTLVAEIDNGKIKTFELSPADFGLETGSLDTFRAQTAEESAAVIRDVLGFEGNLLDFNKERHSAIVAVLMNAMAAFHIAGYDDGSLSETYSLAMDSIRNRHALKKMEVLAEAVKS